MADNQGSVNTNAIRSFDFAIATICPWLVPRLISRHRLYHRSLRRSLMWVRTNAPPPSSSSANRPGGDTGGGGGLALCEKSVTKSMQIALIISIIIYTVTAIILSLMTRNIDNRTSYIIVGLSNVVGAVFIFLLSYSAPQWLGVYASIYSEDSERRTSLGATLNALCFKVRLHVFRTFFKVYPIIIPFFLGSKPATIPVSVAVGCTGGLLMCLAIDYGNRNITDTIDMHKFALVVAFVFIVASALMFSFACAYIHEVWGDHQNKKDGTLLRLEVLSFVIWFCWGCYFAWAGLEGLPTYETDISSRSGMTVIRSNKSKGNLSKSSSADEENGRHNRSSELSTGISTIGEAPGDNSHRRTSMMHLSQEMSVIGLVPGEESQTSIMNLDDEETAEPFDTTAVVNTNANTRKSMLTRKEIIHKKKQQSAEGRLPSPPNVGHFNDLRPVSEDSEKWEEEVEDFEDEDFDVNRCHLVNVVCCELSCGEAGREKTFQDKCGNCLRWTAWTLMMLASLFWVVLLIGAQHQEAEVRRLLPEVHHILYSNMNTGPVCTYNDNYNATTIRERVEATQRTFPTKDEAILAGYTVLHCGACAACSNYPDLRQQWTTREILGQVALVCAKKTLVGGGFDALRECTMEKTGFEYDCATCWTQDYVCVKKSCIFISIRAFMINTVTNLQVGKDDITPSTCEEAMCEATEITGYIGFVPCSGASRRRMDIKSSIKRPADQQCRNVDVPSWENFFGHSTGHGDYPTDYNPTTLH